MPPPARRIPDQSAAITAGTGTIVALVTGGGDVVKANCSDNPEDVSRVMRLLGSRKSAAKTAAARRNGKLGGRPRKKKGTVVATLLIPETEKK